MIYYGSAFDPITEAHEAIIKTLMTYNEKLVIGISNDDEKTYTESLENRINTFNYAINIKGGLDVLEQTERTFTFIENNFKGESVSLCIGSDNMDRILKGDAGGWKNTDKLINRVDKFYVIPRTPDVHYDMPDKIVLVDIDLSKYTKVSSTSIRNKFYYNPNLEYSNDLGVSVWAFDWIKRNGLYHQNKPENQIEEAKFIENYNPNKFPKPSVTADILVTYKNKVLLIRRKNHPYKNYWCLPGGFFIPENFDNVVENKREFADEDINFTAQRELKEETGLQLDINRFEQIKTYAGKFDPRMRIVDVAFSVKLNSHESELVKIAKADDDAADLNWFSLVNLPKLGFHHAQIIADWKADKRFH